MLALLLCAPLRSSPVPSPGDTATVTALATSDTGGLLCPGIISRASLPRGHALGLSTRCPSSPGSKAGRRLEARGWVTMARPMHSLSGRPPAPPACARLGTRSTRDGQWLAATSAG